MYDVTIDDVRAARRRLIPAVKRTPMLHSGILSALAGTTVWLKAENLQHTGSFKIRGASNRIAMLTPDERSRGVIAASAGNHAQGVADAARAHGVRATIVMPKATPLAKIEATRGYGATIILHGETYDEARDEAGRLAEESGAIAIPAYDDPLIVAGQGTVGEEIAEDLPDVEVVIVPVGGGGLAAGIGVALAAMAPRAKLIGVQVEAATGVRRSLDEGRAVTMAPAPTIAEGIAVGGPGGVFPLLQRHLDDVVVVDDDAIAQAMVLLIERTKLVVEGAGAAGVAAVMSGRLSVARKRVAIVLSGGNVDINTVARVVEHGLTQAGRYLTLTVGLDDKPGRLAALAALLGEAGANILSVAHHRFGIHMAVGQVQAVLLLEVRDRVHAGEVETALATHGFVRGPADGPEFVPARWLRR